MIDRDARITGCTCNNTGSNTRAAAYKLSGIIERIVAVIAALCDWLFTNVTFVIPCALTYDVLTCDCVRQF